MQQKALKWAFRREKIDNRKTGIEEFKEISLGLLANNYLSGALAFAQRIKDKEIAAKVLALACEEGNFFLYKGAASVLNKKELKIEDLNKLINLAQEHGKLLYAQQAENYLKENFS